MSNTTTQTAQQPTWTAKEKDGFNFEAFSNFDLLSAEEQGFLKKEDGFKTTHNGYDYKVRYNEGYGIYSLIRWKSKGGTFKKFATWKTVGLEELDAAKSNALIDILKDSTTERLQHKGFYMHEQSKIPIHIWIREKKID